MNELFELIRSDSALYNRTLARAIGLNEAIIFSALLSKENYYCKEGWLDEEGMFYSTAADLEESTTLTQRQQDRAVKRLEILGLIITKVKNMPARKYFRINPDTQILSHLLKKTTDSKPSEDSKSAPEPISRGENASTKSENKFQQNVETSIDETSKQVSTKCENMNPQNVEQKVYNKTYKKTNKLKSIKHNARSYPQTYPQDCERIMNAWNSLGLNPVKAIKGNGEIMLNALIEQYSANQVVRAVESIKESDLLRGRRPSGFVIQFGWFLKPNNFVKVLKGNYIDKHPLRRTDDIRRVERGIDMDEYFTRVTEIRMRGG